MVLYLRPYCTTDSAQVQDIEPLVIAIELIH